MRRMAALGALIFALMGVSTVEAAPEARVDALQGPVWVERQGERLALAPGELLKNRDRLVTGAGGRAVVQLADGSAVKLGEHGVYAFNAMRQQTSSEGRGQFSAAIDVARGAFRLTTQVFHKLRSDRAINVRTGTVTIGIRGTDVWGRAAAERDFVCLLEGRIIATHPDAEAVVLDTPLAFYGAERGAMPGPVAQAEREQVAQWSAETEILPLQGVQRRGGRWQLYFGPYDPASAERVLRQLQAQGQAAQVLPLPTPVAPAYWLKIGQLATAADAGGLEARLRQVLSDLPEGVVRRH